MFRYHHVLVPSLVLLLIGVHASSCKSDDEQKGGVVGFATGTEKQGSVPSDGSSADAPKINELTLGKSEIKSPEALQLSITFEDPQGDVALIHFGILGEAVYYELANTLGTDKTSGTILLELYPKHYVPGNYTLVVSLADGAGHDSQAQQVTFTILNPDGTRPPDSAVTKDSGPGTDLPPVVPSGPTFIMGYSGEAEKGTPAALVKVSLKDGQASVETLNQVLPHYSDAAYMDFRNGRVAMWTDSTPPEGRGKIAVFDLASPTQVKYIKIPAAEKGYYYTIENKRPQILPDGRIVAGVVLETEAADDYHGNQLMIWDPKTDETRLQGLLNDFVLGQPEVQSCNCDAEGGAANGYAFAVSADGKYVYFSAGSYGTEAMVHHGGPCFLARWNIAAGTTERMAFTDTESTPYAVSPDGKKVVVSHDGKWKLLDTSSKTLADYDPWPDYVGAGKMSSLGTFIKGWRCGNSGMGGIGLYDVAPKEPALIIDGNKLPSPYRGLGQNVQISADGKTLYFVASSDGCTNYAAKLAIMKAPVGLETTEQAVSLGELEAPYWSMVFVLVQ